MKKIKDNITDVLVYTSLLIMIVTTLILNIYIGLYLLSIILMGLAIIINKVRR